MPCRVFICRSSSCFLGQRSKLLLLQLLLPLLVLVLMLTSTTTKLLLIIRSACIGIRECSMRAALSHKHQGLGPWKKNTVPGGVRHQQCATKQCVCSSVRMFISACAHQCASKISVSSDCHQCVSSVCVISVCHQCVSSVPTAVIRVRRALASRGSSSLMRPVCARPVCASRVCVLCVRPVSAFSCSTTLTDCGSNHGWGQRGLHPHPNNPS